MEGPPEGFSTSTATGFHVLSGREGARSQDPDKYRKDALVLQQALQTEQDPFLRARYTFYLARSYRDAGEREKALDYYLKRAELGHWTEEIFESLYGAAELMRALGRPLDEILAMYRRASDAVPSRAEALHSASRLCRENNRFAEGFDYARRGLEIPHPAGGLFVQSWIYDYALLDEYAVNGYWAERYEECVDACDRLLQGGKLPPEYRDRILKNRQFARDKLQAIGTRPVIKDVPKAPSDVTAPDRRSEVPCGQTATASEPQHSGTEQIVIPEAGVQLAVHETPGSKMRTHPRLAPVFLLTQHRGGGTLLARILNCHPDLVIWGEHVGLINRLAEIDDMVTRVGRLMAPKTDVALADYAAFPDRRLTEFDPWANPFDYDIFCQSCRDMIEQQFTRGLQPGQRWGFKEIRYHRVLTVLFLQKLFPDARFVILRRDVQELAVSAILASWSLRWFWDYRETMPTAMAEAIVRDVTYALLAIEHGLDAVESQLGPHGLWLDYHELLDPALGFAQPLFDFCRVSLTEPVLIRVRRVLEVRAGGTDHGTIFGGILSRDFIREQVAALAPELRAEIARDGIDKARLLASDGVGRYSFLMGDHTLRDRGSELSGLF
jgi:hypothetical protein